MTRLTSWLQRGAKRGGAGQGFALLALLLMAGFAVLGPTGLLAWGELDQALQDRQAQIVALEQEQARLENRVALLDPSGADPDLVGELLREKLNVVHPDEVVLTIDRADTD